MAKHIPTLGGVRNVRNSHSISLTDGSLWRIDWPWSRERDSEGCVRKLGEVEDPPKKTRWKSKKCYVKSSTLRTRLVQTDPDLISEDHNTEYQNEYPSVEDANIFIRTVPLRSSSVSSRSYSLKPIEAWVCLYRQALMHFQAFMPNCSERCIHFVLLVLFATENLVP